MTGKMRRGIGGRPYGLNADTTPEGDYSESKIFNAPGPALPRQRARKMSVYAITGSSAPTLVLPGNVHRVYLIVQNLSTATNLYMGFGSGAFETSGILIKPDGGNYLADYNVPIDDIYLYFTAGAAERAIISEGVLVQA